MTTTSPLPGALSSPRLAVSDNRPPGLSPRRVAYLVAHEDSDQPATIAVAASYLAAAWCLGDLFFGAGFLGLFSYRVVRVLLYGAPFLFGGIIAAGFISRSRTARFTAGVATVSIAATALAFQLGLAGPAMWAIKLGSGAALLTGAVLWSARALRRLILRRDS